MSAKHTPAPWCSESGKDFNEFGHEGEVDDDGRLRCKCGRRVKLIERAPFSGHTTRWVGKEASHRIPRHRTIAMNAAQRELLARLCGPKMLSLRGAEIRTGQVLVKQGLAQEVGDCTWRLLPTNAGRTAIAKATGSAA